MAIQGQIEEGNVWEGLSRLLTKTPGAHVRVTTIDVWERDGEAEAQAPRLEGTVISRGMIARPPSGSIRPRWNVQGHAVVAMLAADILAEENPAAFTALQELMKSDPLGRGNVADGTPPVGAYAQWPDRIKRPGRSDPDNIRKFGSLGQQHRVDHYVNYPYDHRSGSTALPDHSIGDGRILPALDDWQQQLAKEKDPQARCTALAFILHLVGDIHQPLHCTTLVDPNWFPGDDGDQGGNLIWWGASQNLHGFWDDIIAKRTDDIVHAHEVLHQKLDRSAFTEELKRQTFPEWAAESFQVAIAHVYKPFLEGSKDLGAATRVDHLSGSEHDGHLFDPPTPAYQEQARNVAQRQVLVAAFRLADVLAKALL